MAATSVRTSSAEPTFGTTMRVGAGRAAAARSASCHSVSMPLTRMVRLRGPYAPDAAAAGGVPGVRLRVRGDRVLEVEDQRRRTARLFAFSSARALELGM